MTCYRPTMLKLASAHCPRAVDYYEHDRPAFREHMQEGIAAHECLAAIGVLCRNLGRAPELGEMATICQQMAQTLATDGRSFEGRAEPPISMEDAQGGGALALRYASAETTVWSATARYEVGWAFDVSWRKVDYNSQARRRFRLILDYFDIVEDAGDEYSGRLAVVRDYKSSWATDEGELNTYQMRAQAVAAWLVAGDIDGVRREVVNLRSGQTFCDELWLENGGKEQLEEWRRDITAYMTALDKMLGADGARPVRPGAGCLSCPWALSCDASAIKGATAERMGERLALLEGQRAQLIKALKLAAKDRPQQVGNSLVGWRPTCDATPIEGAARAMFDAWAAAKGDINGFIAALRPGMGALRAVAKLLSPDDTERQEQLIAGWSQPKPGREFTIWRA